MSGWLRLSGLRPRFVPWMTAAVLALAFPAMGAAAVPEIRINPATLYFGAAAPSSVAQQAESPAVSSSPAGPVAVPQALRDKAAAGGAVRVLVQLAMPFAPEGTLGSGRALEQRQAIGQVQGAALLKLAGAKAKVHARYGHIPFLALEVDAAALDLLSRLPEVTGIQEDVLQKPLLASSNAVIGSGVAWAKGLTGAGQVIAVLDTGVDKTHPYFSSGGHNKVVSEACYSSNISSDYPYDVWTSACPGGVTESTAPGSGVNCPVASSTDCRHGTHVAGIAAGNDGVGPNFGVARDADIISIQIFSMNCYFGCDIGAWLSDELKGLERVYDLAGTYNIAAVNVSVGIDGDYYSSRSGCDAYNPALKQAIDNLRSIDVATVGAAGNNYYYFSVPGCISSAISVGTTDDNDNLAYFSPSGPGVDLMAPGVSITSAVPGGGTATFDGTSMSAPHVAGAWAILRQQHPSATVSDVLSILRDTAVRVSGNGYTDMRRINVAKAVTAGPFVNQDFTIYNDGGAVLSVLSMQLETPVSWIRWTPEAPFDVAPGSSRKVSVSVDFGAAPSGVSMNRLIVGSTDADENPYPDAVHLVIGKEACYPLTRSRTGFGGNPEASPTNSSGCAPGEYHAGESIQLTAHPSVGWAVQSWSGTSNDAGTAAANSLTMPASPWTVSVVYYAPCFALTRSHTGSGADPVAAPTNSPGCPVGQYKYAEPIQLTAAPTRGWRIGGWTHTSADGKHDPANSLAMSAGPLTVSVTYLEGLPSVLVVGEGYNLSSFTAALSGMGTIYEAWDLSSSGNPPAATLSRYPRVLWDTYYYSLSSEQEDTLTSYLTKGGGLILSSQAYSVTPFLQSYMGAADLNSEYSDIVTGAGSVFGGLGPFTVWDYNTIITPMPGAEVALLDRYGATVGVSKVGPTYRTLFPGGVFQSVYSQSDLQALLGPSLDFIGTVFTDAPRGYWAKKWIEAMYRNGVTTGCASNPRQYCPDSAVTRGQMAVFLLLAKEAPGYSPPPCATAPFTDVPASSPLCPWIKELARRGVTSGCGGGNFCPDSVVTRDQMSVFLLSTLEGPGYAPPACAGSSPFVDIPVSSPFCPWVAELSRRGISSGCNPGVFCPTNPVNRAQMAVFLVSNFHLPVF